jgi:hypothetical protein
VAQQSQRRFRRFLSTRLGQVFLVALAALVVFVTYAFVLAVIAIPAFLLFGLAVPIWSGQKRPRFLAVLGLVVVLVVAPTATYVFTEGVRTPVGTADSGVGVPFSTGTALMQNATVSPYIGSADTNFTWTVTIVPKSVPPNNSTPVELDLFISTCPGATGNNSPNCQQPYPFTLLTNTSLPPNATVPYNVTFHYRIGSDGIWDWQMGIYTKNRTTGTPYFQLLIGDPTYNGIQGPIVGTFTTTYSELVATVYFQDLLFLGAPFFFVLLIYMLFKNRERRRKEALQRAMGPVPPSAPAGGGPGAPSGAPLPSSKTSPGAPGVPPAVPATVQEFNCPNCNAVVYAGEKSCWKCGASVPAASTPS